MCRAYAVSTVTNIGHCDHICHIRTHSNALLASRGLKNSASTVMLISLIMMASHKLGLIICYLSFQELDEIEQSSRLRTAAKSTMLAFVQNHVLAEKQMQNTTTVVSNYYSNPVRTKLELHKHSVGKSACYSSLPHQPCSEQRISKSAVVACERHWTSYHACTLTKYIFTCTDPANCTDAVHVNVFRCQILDAFPSSKVVMHSMQGDSQLLTSLRVLVMLDDSSICEAGPWWVIHECSSSCTAISLLV